jgi:hypothetical protein
MTKSLVAGLVALAALIQPTSAFAAETNATVLDQNVNCRSYPPTFAVSTLFTFRLKFGKVVEVLPKTSRITITAATDVVGGVSWYKVQTNPKTTCWASSVDGDGKPVIRTDDNFSVPFIRVEVPLGSTYVSLPISAAIAQAPAQAAATEQDGKVRPIPNILIAAIAVAIFVASLVCLKRWVFPKNDVLVWVSSLSVLLLLGVLSESAFSAILTQWLTAPKPSP